MRKIILMFFVSVVLISCSTSKEESNSVSTVDNKVEISPLVNDAEFSKTIHKILNLKDYTSAIVRADGTMIMNAIRPENEYLHIIKDERTKEAKYIAKTITGDDKVEHTYGEGDMSYTYSEPTIETIFYDSDGKEIGLRGNMYDANLAVGDKIFYNSQGEDYYNNLYLYDVKRKETIKLDKSAVYFYANHIILSTVQYVYNDYDKGKKELLICDDDLNVIKRIEDYSYYGLDTSSDGEFQIAVVSKVFVKNDKKALSDMTYGEDFEYRYNYLDENFNLIFDTPVEAKSSMGDKTIVKIHEGDVEYDYDLKLKKKVSDDRPYSGFDNYNEMVQAERSKYDLVCEKIAIEKDYMYADARVYNDIALIFAHKNDNKYNEEEDVYYDYVDIYDKNEQLLLNNLQLNSVYDEEGYFLVNNDTLYDFNLNVVKQFDTDVYFSRNSKKSKVFYMDDNDKHYRQRPHFNVYDDKMNVLFENVVDVEFYSYDDYIVLATDDTTKIMDSDLNVIKEYDRSLEIHHWYNESPYRNFVDLKTKREGIIDDKYNIIVDNLKSVSNFEDKCFTFVNGFRYGLMDYNQKVICDFSIFNTMTDDSVQKDFDIRYIE